MLSNLEDGSKYGTGKMDAPRTLHCYAFGRDGEWEAICLDLDIAVQGESFESVFRSLREAIELYLASLRDLPEADQQRLLHRPAPLPVRLKFLWQTVSGVMSGQSDRFHHQFTMPLAA